MSNYRVRVFLINPSQHTLFSLHLNINNHVAFLLLYYFFDNYNNHQKSPIFSQCACVQSHVIIVSGVDGKLRVVSETTRHVTLQLKLLTHFL